MTKEEGAKILAVKYVLDYNTFRLNDKLKEDLVGIHFMFGDDEEFNRMFERYCDDLRKVDTPRWAKMIMAERYAINI